MNNIKQDTKAYIVAMLVLAIGLVSFGINTYRTSQKLEETKTILETTQEELRVEIEQHNQALKGYEVVREELETANTIIDALKSDEYITGVTVTNKDIDMLAKTVWGEARGCNRLEQSAVVWCILNRVDAGRGTIAEVITAPGQFHGYSKNFPVTDEIRELCEDVVARWKLEKLGVGNVGRTLPSDYLYFWADSTGIGNVFRNKFSGNYTKWNWDCWNPYE